MNNRNYNIFFHLHTVSGITITVGLFIIFFGGAFALFRQEIGEWESGKYEDKKRAAVKSEKTDYNRILDSIEKNVPSLYGRNVYVYSEGTSDKQAVYISGSEDPKTDSLGKLAYEYEVNPENYTLMSHESSFSLGELLYLLHFYYQLDRIGYYISGLVALFFFLAIVTGILVHWQKIRSNFFVFRPRQKLKTVWTDAHTALGVIGLPFQFIYALTGSMFGLGIVVAGSNALWIYNGDTEKMYDDVIRETTSADTLGKKQTYVVDYNKLVAETAGKWPDFKVDRLHIAFYGSQTMKVEVSGSESIRERFLGQGSVTFKAETGKELQARAPGNMGYYDDVWSSVRRLHYAQFGDIGTFSTYFLKIIYFLMAFLTCFVIISGVLIWLEARNKKNITEKKRRYNELVGAIYLAICLSMLPITAASFILSKVLPETLSGSRESILNYSFFLGWLVLSIVLSWKRNKGLTNKFCLLTGGILGLIIPVVNGVSSGNWFWRTFSQGEYGIFSVDIIWLCIGIICLLVVKRLRKNGVEIPASVAGVR
ncbi:PepSY-associated TM helix domain-containing protein [Fluviicola sp.]|uniref:PepSY-associated TM helix domain-containing protein n=1 Tax=Fluviicola sp. TaxID=1917219 RepID=UPI0031DD43C7